MARRKLDSTRMKDRKGVNAKVKGAAEVIAENREERKHGRPTSYHIGFDHIAEQACIINADSPGLADMFGVDVSTVEAWMRAHPSFQSSVKRGKARTDDEVERSLIHRAKGYSHPSEEIVILSEGKGGSTYVERVQVTKQYPPDATSAIFWLKNRRPQDYRPDSQLAPVGAQPDDAARVIRETLAAMTDDVEKPE